MKAGLEGVTVSDVMRARFPGLACNTPYREGFREIVAQELEGDPAHQNPYQEKSVEATAFEVGAKGARRFVANILNGRTDSFVELVARLDGWNANDGRSAKAFVAQRNSTQH